MTIKKVNLYFWFVHRLPAKIRYFCFMDVMAHSTTGKYGNTIVPELSGMEAIQRFGHDHGMAGHGK